ncbi:MAG: DNA polymerase III subunit delta' [Gammaproteobacteria bacterium]|nr:DNA polymerase III subunit delta' [Gammaproteobacteria bacterium]
MNVLPWQQSQWTRVLDAHHNGRLPHALLLTGPDGAGLGEFAALLAGALLCRQSSPSRPHCGSCRDCVLVQAGNHPDILRVRPEEPGKQIRVEEIRDLLEFMHLTSQSGRHKIAIISPAEAMNKSASNTLLKTLEEPPAGSLLILCCHAPGQLPVTVRSRCQRLDFPGDSGHATCRWLERKLGVDPDLAAALLRRAGGAPFRAMALAECDALAKQNELLGDLCQLRQGHRDPVAMARRWAGFGFPAVLVWLLEILRSITVRKVTVSGSADLYNENGHLQQIADELDLMQLVTAYDVAARNYQGATGPHNLNKLGLLEEFIVYWQSTASTGRR